MMMSNNELIYKTKIKKKLNSTQRPLKGRHVASMFRNFLQRIAEEDEIEASRASWSEIHLDRATYGSKEEEMEMIVRSTDWKEGRCKTSDLKIEDSRNRMGEILNSPPTANKIRNWLFQNGLRRIAIEGVHFQRTTSSKWTPANFQSSSPADSSPENHETETELLELGFSCWVSFFTH